VRAIARFRPALGVLAALSLLVGQVPAASAGPGTAASPRVEQGWTASVGAKGANGAASIRILDTAAGSVSLELRGLRASASYAVAVRAGACGKLGASVATLGTVRASTKGTVKATLALSIDQAAAIRGAAVGTRRISLVVGSGSAARCGTLAKSVAVTPQVWFGPLPGWTPPTTLPGTNGAVDFGALIAPNAPWARVAGGTHVFMLYPGTSADTPLPWLRQLVAALKARDIRIALDMWMLEPGADGCGVGVNGFGMGADAFIALIRRIESVGGTVSYVSLANPFWAGVRYDGPNACHWSVETVARKVAAWVKKVRSAVPGVQIGLIEQYYGPASIGHVEDFITAYDRAVGGRLPFFHLDVDYTVAGWPEGAREIEQWVRARGTRFGLFYTSWPPAESDAEWFAGATANVRAFELDGGAPPDDAIFESWTDHPDYALPETGATTMTRLVADYLRTRTTMTSTTSVPAATGGAIAALGTVRTLGGDPIVGAPVSLTATPRDGPYQVIEFRGQVPKGGGEALIQLQVNQTPLRPGSADLTFYEVGYAEGSGTANLVPNPRFDEQAVTWGHWGEASLAVVPSDRGAGSMVRIVATPMQTMIVNSASFQATAGAQYRLWVAARVPEAAIGTTDVNFILLGGNGLESQRVRHHLAPVPIDVATSATDATGAWSIPSARLEAGRYRLLAEYAGDATYWPARARSELTVP
jgi:hypothetical protein